MTESEVRSNSYRRALAGRRAETTDRLLDAVLETLREQSFEHLSMREVCERSGLTHATAYRYFSSKQHLVAEAYWRRIERWCAQPIHGGTPLERLTTVFEELGHLMAGEPDLSVAASAAVLSRDPDVARIRGHIGITMAERLRRATGPDCSDRMLDALNISVSGAMIQAGMNYYSYPEMTKRLVSMARLLLIGEERTDA